MIRGYRAVLDPGKRDAGVIACIMVGLSIHERA